MNCLPKTLHLHVCSLGFHDNHLRSIRVFFKTPIDQLSTSVSASPSVPNPTKPKPLIVAHNPLIVEQLIEEYGISRRKAISVSRLLSHSTSLVTLSPVPNFFKQFGFSDTHIRNIICKDPSLLLCKVDTVLEPKLMFLQEEFGLSNASLADLITSNPRILKLNIENHLIPTVHILRSWLHSNEKIVKVLNKNSRLLSGGKLLGANVGFLRQYGLPNHLISLLLYLAPLIFIFKLDLLKDIVGRVEQFGIKRDSGSFVYAVMAISSMSKSTLEGKFQLYKSYGLSEADIVSAFMKCPRFLCLSEGKIRKMMSFLMDDLGLSPKDIVLMPNVSNFSVEKRLKPRTKVMKILNSKGLLKKKYLLSSILQYSEKKFVEKFVVKFLDRAPELAECFEDL